MSLPEPTPEPPIPSLELNPLPKEDALALVRERLARLEYEVVQLRDTAALEDRLLRRLREEAIAHNGAWTDKFQAGPPPAPPPPPPSPSVERLAAATGSGWLLVESVRELRLVFRMFFDRSRFRISVSTWIIVILFLPAILLSKWWFPPSWIFVLGDYFDKVLDVILAWVVYKALSREARRYQAVLKERT